MSTTEVIAIDDDEDEEIKIVFADFPPPSKVTQLRLQIDLLQAFCKSSQPIPMEYHKFYKFAKKVRSNVSDTIISEAWKRAITKQLNCMIKKNSHSLRKDHSNIASTIDLTEPNFKATSSSSPWHSKTQLNKPHRKSGTEGNKSPTAVPVPVALIANPQYHQNIDNPTEPLTVNNETTDIDVALVDELENVTNCLVKVINESIQFSEGSNESFMSEEESKCNTLTSNMWTEASPLCHAFNWEVFNDVNEESIESDDSNLSANKKRKIKNKVFEEVSPATISKQNSTKRARKPNKTISISEAELKLFKEEQKIKKFKEKQELMCKQLEKLHGRLFDVLKPKLDVDSPKDN